MNKTKSRILLSILVTFLILALAGCGVVPPINQSPTASFTAIPTSRVVPLEVFFNASGSYDPDGDIISYAWDFKDGNTGSGEIVSHTFSSIGNYDVKLTVTDNKGATDSTTKTIIINENGMVYRALCVGVGDYIYYDDLYSPSYSVDRMHQILSQCRFGPLDTGFSIISSLKDRQATRLNILRRIASTFSGANNYDVSYFYYSGHGYRGEGISYLCPADSTSISSLISVDELENALSAIPGTKVIILDTCYSGGFIGKRKGEITISQEELESFNDEVINVFSQSQSKSLLTTNQYKVLTSCSSNQGCWERIPVFGNPYSVFTKSLCTGCGYFNHNYPADSNGDTKVSLQEAYIYVKDWVQYYFSTLQQDVQVYPDNSNYPIVEY
ncbi:hypothetical protein ES708_26769 [subsurface metagenome]